MEQVVASDPAMPRASRLLRVVLPAVSLGIGAAHLILALQGAGFTLGFDYLAYDAAARRLLAGGPLYDLAFTASGTFGLFYYPPTFILLVIPFTLVDPGVALWAWLATIVGAFLVGVRLLPVQPGVRWLVVLLAAITWPFVFGVRLGQVGPLLFLAFAAGWRWLDYPDRLGAAAAAGALIKLQPGLVLAWALFAGRWRAVVTGGSVIAAGIAVSSLVAGPGAWPDFLVVLRRVYDPLTTSQNLSPGATAYFMGTGLEVAALVQLVSTVLVLGVVVLAARRLPSDVGYLSAVVASQLVSPFLWDHYAIVLMLPVAWLLERRHWWALLVPLSQAYVLVPVVPPISYLASYYVLLLAPALTTLALWRRGDGAIAARRMRESIRWRRG